MAFGELILCQHICGSKHLSYLGKALVTLILSYFWLYLRAYAFHLPVPLTEVFSVPSLCCLCLQGCCCFVPYDVTAVMCVATEVTGLQTPLLLLKLPKFDVALLPLASSPWAGVLLPCVPLLLLLSDYLGVLAEALCS